MNSLLVAAALALPVIVPAAPAPQPRPHALTGVWQWTEQGLSGTFQFDPDGTLITPRINPKYLSTVWVHDRKSGAFAVSTTHIDYGTDQPPWCFEGVIDLKAGRGSYTRTDGIPGTLRRLP